MTRPVSPTAPIETVRKGPGCGYVRPSSSCALGDKHCLEEFPDHPGEHLFGSPDGPITESEWVARHGGAS